MKKRQTQEPSKITPGLDLLVQIVLLFQLASTALYYNGFFTNPLINKMLLGQHLALVAWALYLFRSLWAREFILVWTPMYLPAFALFVWAGIRSLTAPQADALASYYPFALILAALPLWVTYFRQPRFRSLYVWSIFMIGVVILIGCLRQLLVDDPSFDWPWFKAMTLTRGSYDRQTLGSFFGHNKTSAAYIAITMVYAGLLWYRHRRSYLSILFIGYLALAFIIMYLNGSRGEALMIPAALAVILPGLWFRRKRGEGEAQSRFSFTKQQWVGAGVLSLLFLILIAVVLNRAAATDKGQNVLARFFTSADITLAGTYPRVWWMSILMAEDKPLFGVGFSAWSYVYPEYQADWFNNNPNTVLGLPEMYRISQDAHNDYLQTWAELGMIGLLIMLWALILWLRSVRRVLWEKPYTDFGLFAAAATAGMMVDALFGFPFHTAAASCLFLADLGLLCQQSHSKPLNLAIPWVSAPKADSRKWAALAVVPVYFLMSYPINNYIVGDFTAMLHDRWANMATPALHASDPVRYREILQTGNEYLALSTNYLPDDGDNLATLAKEYLQTALVTNDESLLRQTVDLFERSFRTRAYYEDYHQAGRAYHALWKITQDPEHLQRGLELMEKAVRIMHINEPAWVSWISLMAEANMANEGVEAMRLAELKYPGFIERSIIPNAIAAQQRGNIELSALLYHLAIGVTSKNPVLFKAVQDFYQGIDRLDMAEYQLLAMAEEQEIILVEEQATQLLLTFLKRRKPVEGYLFMKKLMDLDDLHPTPALWFYTGLSAWLAGQPHEAYLYWVKTCEMGAPQAQMQPLLEVSASLLKGIIFF